MPSQVFRTFTTEDANLDTVLDLLASNSNQLIQLTNILLRRIEQIEKVVLNTDAYDELPNIPPPGGPILPPIVPPIDVDDFGNTFSLVNTSTTVFEEGMFFGINPATGIPAKAIGGSSPIIATAICTGVSGPGDPLKFVSWGPRVVQLETPRLSPTVGQPVWLSSTVAGTATNARPATGARQTLGQFYIEGAPFSGSATANLFIDPRITEAI